MTDPEELWSSFTHDPRLPAHASLRASDRDRDLVHQVLAESYADGRLDRAELDVRTAQVAAARTLGELPGAVEGLVPTSSVPAVVAGAGLLTGAQIQERAVAEWRSDLRQALWGFLSASLICWVIWVVGSWGPGGLDPDFPWPVFVMLGTGLNVGRVRFQREEMVAEERRRLEKKQRKEIEKRRRDAGEQE